MKFSYQFVKYFFQMLCITLLIGITACKTYDDNLTDKIETIESIESEGEVLISSEDMDKPPKRRDRPAEALSMTADGTHAVRMTSMAKSAAPRGGQGEIGIDIEPGQITAAEWNDLHNWKDWLDLQQNIDFEEMQNYWAIYPENRVSVFLRNRSEVPIKFAKVVCKSKGKVLWTAYTDNTGKAELWPNLYNSAVVDDLSLEVVYGGELYSYQNIRLIDDGVNSFVLDAPCVLANGVDIMFVVDATGSMSDEIRYLQSELGDVIERFSSESPNVDLRTGAVFYRDHQDEYLTRVSNLSEDPKQTLNFIDEQGAAGGGDYPEAVESALEEALSQNWRSKDGTKLLFLLLDAPPHEDSLTKAKIHSQIQLAAEKGIKIIPITASGINRETEFLMKYMAIATNGTYVFITDHSGIGNAHLDPVVENYEVEKLNELLLRLIQNYAHSDDCEPLILKSKRDIKVYPNPTSNYITVESEIPMEIIEVHSNSGKLLISVEVDKARKAKIDLSPYVDGMYIIVSIAGDLREVQSVIKVAGY